MSTTYNQIQQDATTAGGFKILLTITDNTGVKIPGTSSIVIDMPGLAAIIAANSLTNLDVGWQYRQYKNPSTCEMMQYVYLGTAPEAVP